MGCVAPRTSTMCFSSSDGGFPLATNRVQYFSSQNAVSKRQFWPPDFSAYACWPGNNTAGRVKNHPRQMLRRDLTFTLALAESDDFSCNTCTYRACHSSAAAKQLKRNGIQAGVADGTDDDIALLDRRSRSGSSCSRTYNSALRDACSQLTTNDTQECY
jgi:hypothetical protein